MAVVVVLIVKGELDIERAESTFVESHTKLSASEK